MAPKPAHRMKGRRCQETESQEARGRPSAIDRRCGNMDCCRECCMYEEPSAIVSVREANEQGISTEKIYIRFLTMATRLVWPTRDRVYKRLTKYHLAESFIMSPPVYIAYWVFTKLARDAEVHIESELQLRECILSLLPTFQKALFSRDRVCDVHRYLETAAGGSVRARVGMGDFVLKYLVSVELWRRREVSLGRDWKFEDDECTCAFLASTLLQLWTMDSEGCFEMQDEEASKREWDIVWERWFDKYPRLEFGDDPEDHIIAHRQFGMSDDRMILQAGYIGGIGRCPPGWLQKS